MDDKEDAVPGGLPSPGTEWADIMAGLRASPGTPHSFVVIRRGTALAIDDRLTALRHEADSLRPLGAERDLLRQTVEQLLAFMPNSEHPGEPCWDWAWEELSGDAQEAIVVVTQRARELLGIVDGLELFRAAAKGETWTKTPSSSTG